MNWIIVLEVFFGFLAIMLYMVGVMKVSDWLENKTDKGWIGFVVWMCGSVGVILSLLGGFLL